MSIALMILAAAAGQYPDALDHLRMGTVLPQVGLLLDRSCSMADGLKASSCSWFAANYNLGNPLLNKSQQMKAVLVGCQNANDGLIDRWADKLNLSIYDFGSGTSLRAPFGSSKAVLEAGALAVPITGNTYMSQGLSDLGKYFHDYFDDSNTLACRPNYIVMLSDGNPNGGSATFNYECKPPVENLSVSADKPWLGSDYLRRNDDLLCKVQGDQNIKTYTIGLGAPGDFSPSNLQNIAAYGGGQYFYASDATELGTAFESIVSTIASKTALFFAPIAIQTGSLYSQNYAFSASFRPITSGPWRGTLKKYCVTPNILANGDYDTSVTGCLFVSSDGKTLDTNPDAVDLFTGLRGLAADYGGTGEVLLDHIGAQSGTPTGSHWTRRNVITWRGGQSGYVKVTPTTWQSSDSWANGCDHYKLINLLHGYTYDANCTSGAPIAYSAWPLGDPVDFAPVLLRYGDCEKKDGTPITGACYVVSGSNDGMVHFYDAADGDEKTALIPSELWAPSGIATSAMRDLQDQPNDNFTHRFLLDGDARLFHDDTNGDGIIQKTETAYLLFGLGRGGRAYYSLKVSELPGGVLDNAKNTINPIVASSSGDLQELQDTWSAPWLGLARVGADASTHRVAAFASGHIRKLDLVDQNAVIVPPAPPVPEPPDLSKAIEVSCTGKGHFADFNGYDKSSWCASNYYSGCKGNSKKPCYDGLGVPLDDSTKPLTFNDGVRKAAALRIEFDQFDLESSDHLRIEDSKGNLIGSYTGTSLAGAKSPWIYDEHFVLRFVTNGNDSKDRGYSIANVEWVPETVSALPPPVSGGGPVDYGPLGTLGEAVGVHRRPRSLERGPRRVCGPDAARAGDAPGHQRLHGLTGVVLHRQADRSGPRRHGLPDQRRAQRLRPVRDPEGALLGRRVRPDLEDLDGGRRQDVPRAPADQPEQREDRGEQG